MAVVRTMLFTPMTLAKTGPFAVLALAGVMYVSAWKTESALCIFIVIPFTLILTLSFTW